MLAMLNSMEKFIAMREKRNSILPVGLGILIWYCPHSARRPRLICSVLLLLLSIDCIVRLKIPSSNQCNRASLLMKQIYWKITNENSRSVQSQ